MCVSAHLCNMLKEFRSLFRSSSFLCVCAQNSFFSVCVSILIFFLYSDRPVSVHFLSIETSITIVLHVVKMLVFHHISSHVEWVKPVYYAHNKNVQLFLYVIQFFSFVRIIYILLCGPDVGNEVFLMLYYKIGAQPLFYIYGILLSCILAIT